MARILLLVKLPEIPTRYDMSVMEYLELRLSWLGYDVDVFGNLQDLKTVSPVDYKCLVGDWSFIGHNGGSDFSNFYQPVFAYSEKELTPKPPYINGSFQII